MTEETIVRLKIVSIHRTPETVTEVLGLQCDRFWHCGDTRADTIIIEKNNGWVLHSGLPKTAPLEEHIEAILRILTPFKEKIKSLSCTDTVELSCVLYASHPPALSFGHSTINRLAELGASLDIDLYVME
jgi:hypothetical protein